MATVEELAKAQETANGSARVPTENENRINAMFDAQKEAQLKELENSHKLSMSAAEEARDKIAPQYQTAANDLSVQYERNRRNFNEQAAANGINTGTASQAALAQNSAYQRDFGVLRKSESEALATANRGIADLTAQYQGKVELAISENDYKRAAALLDEYNAEYQRNVEKAKQLASYGDFSGFEAIYGKDQATNMFYLWAAENPQLAYNAGRITADQRDNLLNNRAINDGLNENGVRVVPLPRASSGGGDGGGWSSGSGGGSFTAYGAGGVYHTGLTASQASAINSTGNPTSNTVLSWAGHRV